MTTRRWYYYIPAKGEPRGLVHAIERHNLDDLPGTMQPVCRPGIARRGAGCAAGRRLANRDGVLAWLQHSLPLARGCRDARVGPRSGVSTVVSSGDLVQQFEAVWTPAQIATHEAASAALYRIKDRAFDVLRQVASGGQTTTEYALQQQMVGWFAEEGLVSSDPPVVAVMANAGNPHYLPTASSHQPIGRDQLVLLDLWGKLGSAGRRVRRHHVDGLHGRNRAATRWRARSTPSPGRATRR